MASRPIVQEAVKLMQNPSRTTESMYTEFPDEDVSNYVTVLKVKHWLKQ